MTQSSVAPSSVRLARILLVLACAVTASFGSASAADAPPAPATAGQPVRIPNSKFPIFFDLFGTWRGEGMTGGLPSKVEMTWAPAIDSRFIRLTWVNDMTSKSGETLHFIGEGTYRPVADADDNHTGTWFDSQGKMYPLFGRVAGDSLSTIWGSEGGTQGRTTYRLVDRSTIRVRDEIRREGNWVMFGVSTLVKQPMAATPSN